MLLLTRKRSEVIQIGDNIVVKVVQTGRRIVKIGIEAPKDVRVLRGELSPVEPPAVPVPVKPTQGVPAPLSYLRRTRPQREVRPMPAEAAVYMPPSMMA